MEVLMKFNHALKIMVLSVASVLVLTACTSTDTVGKFAVKSFDAVSVTLADQIVFDEATNAWALIAPTGERFSISSDFTQGVDTVQEFDLQPFMDAGLDVTKLDTTIFSVNVETNKLLVIGNIGDKAVSIDVTKSMTAAVEGIVKDYRDSVGFHAKLDHYGIAMGNGNMFEWASDMATNDKDIVFILNPEPFINAGADPANIAGWAYAEVEVMDENEKPIMVYKLLKPFDLTN
jgi:hypothetical protein